MRILLRGLPVLLIVGIYGCGARTPKQAATQSFDGACPFPLEQNLPQVSNSGNLDEIKDVGTAFWPPKKSSVGRILHAMHAFHRWPEPRESSKPSLDEMMRVLLDYRVASEWYDGRVPMWRTTYGLRIATPEAPDVAGQSHYDQAIAELGMLGVRLDEPVWVPDGNAWVSDFVSDVIANFRLEGEFEWSALAIVLYFPGESEWTNRFGDRFTIDDIVRALIARRLAATSCLGTHTVFALAAIAQLDEENKTLSAFRRL